MIDALTLDRSSFTGTPRLVIAEAARRGWSVYVLYKGSSYLFIDRGDEKLLPVSGSMLPSLSYVAGSLANNKYATYDLLRHAGVDQLETIVLDKADPLDLAERMLARLGSLVVKPIDGAHGEGITVGVSDRTALQTAIERALTFCRRSSKVVIQQLFPAEMCYDLRLLCVNYRFVAAIHRTPARVIGDGAHSVRELMVIENAKPERGEPYKTKYARIDIERATQYLKHKIDNVAAIGEEVRVMDVANYGAGGELIDVTDDIPLWMQKEAELASQTIGLSVAGIDYLTSRLPAPDMSRDEVEAYIIEVNKSPALMIHDEPHEGNSRQTVRLLLDELERL